MQEATAVRKQLARLLIEQVKVSPAIDTVFGDLMAKVESEKKFAKHIVAVEISGKDAIVHVTNKQVAAIKARADGGGLSTFL
jgi:hypothetical protein